MLSDLVFFTFAGILYAHIMINPEKSAPFYMFRSFWIGLGMCSVYSIILYQWQGPSSLLWAADDSTMPAGFAPWVKFGLHLFTAYLIGYLLGSHGRRYSWLMLSGTWVIVGWLLAEHIAQSPMVYASIWPIPAGFFLLWLVSLKVARRNRDIAIEKGALIPQLLHPGKQRTLQALAEVILPPEPALRPISGKDLPLGREYSTFLANANIIQRIAHRVFIDVLNISPLFTIGTPRRLVKLSREKQELVLERVEESRVFYFKIALSVIKMYLYQFYYGHEKVTKHFNYEPGCLGENRKKIKWEMAPDTRGVLYGSDA